MNQYVEPVLCRVSREAVCRAYWTACGEVGLEPTVDLVTTLVSHGAIETANFGMTGNGLWNFNCGNIKPGSTWKGPYTCLTLNEVIGGKLRWFSPQGMLSGKPGLSTTHLVDEKGNPAEPVPVPPGHIQTHMRAHDTLAKGVRDKFEFLMKPGWSSTLVFAKTGNVPGYIRSIRARSYFTAFSGRGPDGHWLIPDPCPYETTVVSLARGYRPIVEEVARGAHNDLAELAPTVEHVDPMSAQRTDVLDRETIAQLETMVTVWLDEQRFQPRDRI